MSLITLMEASGENLWDYSIILCRVVFCIKTKPRRTISWFCTFNTFYTFYTLLVIKHQRFVLVLLLLLMITTTATEKKTFRSLTGSWFIALQMWHGFFRLMALVCFKILKRRKLIIHDDLSFCASNNKNKNNLKRVIF